MSITSVVLNEVDDAFGSFVSLPLPSSLRLTHSLLPPLITPDDHGWFITDSLRQTSQISDCTRAGPEKYLDVSYEHRRRPLEPNVAVTPEQRRG